MLSRHQPEQRKSSSQNDPQAEAEEAAAEGAGHQQNLAAWTVGPLRREGFGDNADIA
ncbi:hypothetical protein [Peteryoungia algae]|uniref:Uncharacterized protein n=1 Tax=Peteryoungia algae TaxID=2919917 RepID=A0ABT0CZY5_9HYPH|nr:hypothetical protein [Rhizobium sp. SSM4.3]MCJ8238727.1 hypothetical protein [Rhizobium sp. SSM4.3]